jgi:hypothetical protein
VGALAQIKASRFASLRATVVPPRPRVVPARPVLVREPRAFPEASTSPALPTTIRDEMLEFYVSVANSNSGGSRGLKEAVAVSEPAI